MSSPASKKVPLTGWGNFPRATCHVFRPENQREAREVLRAGSAQAFIARGCGRSYSDASLNSDEGVVSQARLNRMIDFDEESGVLTCEGGTTLREIVETFLPRGFFLDVTPGTADVTVGGAIAADVHGKNHLSRGCFTESVREIRLLLPDGTGIDANREQNREIFAATAGGMGLTGFIARASLKLRRIDSPAVAVTTKKTRSLAESIEVLSEVSENHEYSVAWVDVLHARQAGRGLVEGADHVGTEAPRRGQRKLIVPFNAPRWLLASRSVGTFNALRYARSTASSTVAHVCDFNYPLDSITHWPRLYGSRGFIQYQAAIPTIETAHAIPRMLEEVRHSGHRPFLVTLKRFGGKGPGLLSFPVEGITVALDIPMASGLEALSSRLDDIVADSGGRIYLAKNPWLKPDVLRRMYPRLDEFMAIKASIDPAGKLGSSLSRRLGITT